MTGKIYSKLLFSFLLVLGIGTTILDFSLRRIVEHSLYTEAEKSLTGKALLLSQELLEPDPVRLQAQVQQQAYTAGARVTVFDRAGNVVADSNPEVNQANEAGSPEVAALLRVPAPAASPAAVVAGKVTTHRAALSEGLFGSNTRHRNLYVAVPNGQRILRLAYPLDSVNETLRLLRNDLLVASVIAFCLAAMAAFLAALRPAKRGQPQAQQTLALPQLEKRS